MYEPSRNYLDFCVAGFTYWEGVFVAQKLKVGDKLDLRPEDNPYDPNAVALYYQDAKIGYVPRRCNAQLSQLLFYGINAFEAFITQVDLEQSPERQVRVVILVKDARNKN